MNNDIITAKVPDYVPTYAEVKLNPLVAATFSNPFYGSWLDTREVIALRKVAFAADWLMERRESALDDSQASQMLKMALDEYSQLDG